MTDSRAALGSDRLPWLTDEPAPAPAKPKVHKKPALPNLWALAAALMLLLAAASYWLGTRSANDQSRAPESTPRVVTPLPQATTPAQPQVEISPQPEVRPAPAREVRSTPERQVRIERPRPIRQIIVRNPEEPPEEATDESAATATAVTDRPPAKPAAAAERPLKAWPASESAGSKGRIVRVGAFGSRQQAKVGWRYMVQAYPAVSHLKATVVGDHNSRGRHFYRFQIGTTSQAHSEVLCQRMERIHLSCAVVGLPWNPKGVER